ncbi:MAG: flagellar motor switch phosphatase FliY [Oscillospiraceae bacterium]|nr:flagellar motor switch phosphatase FliY [Oscillospiraceae bacterium]
MNLSQDEINALMMGDATEEDSAPPADAGGGDMMSPEAIEAMLAGAGGGDAAPAPPPADAGGGDMMSPEAIEAMLAGASGGDAAPAAPVDAPPASGGGGDIMSAEQIAALLDGAAGEADSDDESDGDAAAMLDGLIASADAPAAGSEEADSPEKVQLDLSKVPSLEGMLTDDEVDILGEVGNISMGAVATTMYALLDKRVSITTPQVHVFDAKDVLSMYQIPFVVATIEYTQGIKGTNLLVLKIDDAALITDLLMGGDGIVEQPIELNEMHLSAMSEIMNQMMGASSTSLSKLLGTAIDISPPKSTAVDVGFDVSTLLGDSDKVTKISFDMEIEGLLKSELIQLMPYDVSRTFAKQFLDVGVGGVVAAPKPEPQAAAAPPPPPAAAPPPPPPPPQVAAAPPPPPPQAVPPAQQPYPPPYPAADPYNPYQQQPYPPPPYPYQQAPYPPPGHPPAQQGRVVDVAPMQFQSFDAPSLPGEAKGIDLVYNIPLQVSVELGRAKKEISEILEFSLGTIVVLEKVAGDPVEIVVNGRLIAKGEVVVIDENYGVRITDIINN